MKLSRIHLFFNKGALELGHNAREDKGKKVCHELGENFQHVLDEV
jgi:hypothetical protein